jgi:hypothetical protein
MRVDLTNPYKEAYHMLETWRSRYSKIEYPFKIVVNTFYRQYTMQAIWDTEINKSFEKYSGIESDIIKSFQHLEQEYSNASQKFTIGNTLINLMNQMENVGGLNYSNSIPLITKAQNGDNKSIEELEFTYLYYFLCNKATLMWAAFGRKGFTKLEAIAQVTGVIIEYSQPIHYTDILNILGQLGCSGMMNSIYNPLPNLY